jgi:hypothetical protein
MPRTTQMPKTLHTYPLLFAVSLLRGRRRNLANGVDPRPSVPSADVIAPDP